MLSIAPWRLSHQCCICVPLMDNCIAAMHAWVLLQIAMSEHLKTLEVYHISTIPKLRLPLDVLFAASLNRDDAEDLFQHLRSQLRKPF